MDRLALGVDLGGSKISYALLDEGGHIFHRVVEPTDAQEGPEAVINRMAARIQDLLFQSQVNVVGIGIGAAGMTDSLHGVVLLASNLRWRDVPLRQNLIDRLGKGWENLIWVDKDTNAAALGELYYGASLGCRHMLYVTVGTGVGGGMILDGRLYHGASEGAGDIGHLVLKPDGILCGCGKYGCLETLASGPAITRFFLYALNQGTASVLASLPPDQISAHSIVEAASKGDRLALGCLEDAGKWLGKALAYYIDINNPERIIVGGGVARAGDLLLEPARRVIAAQALPGNVQTVNLLPAGLIEDSGVIGAATLVWHNLHKG